jgi:hypothetical protein
MPEENEPQLSPKEERHVISEYYDGVKQLEIQGYETAIRKARNALIATAILVFIGELVSAGAAGIGITPEVIGIALVEAGIFAALAFWTRKKPYSAILIGLILFVLMWVASIVINGTQGIFSGIIIRVVVIVYLARALKDAKAWEQTKKSM